jgi:hypothetical protein
MVVMIGSREVKEDMKAKERSAERGRKEGRKGGGVKVRAREHLALRRLY